MLGNTVVPLPRLSPERQTLLELHARCERSAAIYGMLARSAPGRATEFLAKREGVELTMCYIEEALRVG